MRIFPLDIIAGILLVLFIILFVVGVLSYRYRREKGPLLLTVSCPLGALSTVAWLLISIETLNAPRVLPLVMVVISSLLVAVSFLFWRPKK
ncbi:MAG: hypothetical protein ACMUIE_01810 [Thermoplasmatota archaeon]